MSEIRVLIGLGNNAIRTGDRVKFKLPKFVGGSFFKGRVRGKVVVSGHEEFSGVVIKHSYGKLTHQHTFTILLDNGKKKLVKGRNLYPNLIEHIVDIESPDR
jgi:hypothetical protein